MVMSSTRCIGVHSEQVQQISRFYEQIATAREKQLLEIWTTLPFITEMTRITNKDHPQPWGTCAECPVDYVMTKTNPNHLTSIAMWTNMIGRKTIIQLEELLSNSPTELLYKACVNCQWRYDNPSPKYLTQYRSESWRPIIARTYDNLKQSVCRRRNTHESKPIYIQIKISRLLKKSIQSVSFL